MSEVLHFQTLAEARAFGYGVMLYDPDPDNDPLWMIASGEEVRTWDPVQTYQAIIGSGIEPITVAKIDQIKAAQRTDRLKKGERRA